MVEDRFCRKQMEMQSLPALSPLPLEDGATRYRSAVQNSPKLSKLGAEYSQNPNRGSKDYKSSKGQLRKVGEEVVDNLHESASSIHYTKRSYL